MNSSNILQEREWSFPLFAARHALVVAKHQNWRITPEVRGEIQGLPMSYGILRATDGVLCYIELPTGSLFQGHIASFVPEKRDDLALLEEAERRLIKTKRKTKKQVREEADAMLYELLGLSIPSNGLYPEGD